MGVEPLASVGGNVGAVVPFGLFSLIVFLALGLGRSTTTNFNPYGGGLLTSLPTRRYDCHLAADDASPTACEPADDRLPGSSWSTFTSAFEERLRELRWIEGRTISIAYRHPGGVERAVASESRDKRLAQRPWLLEPACFPDGP